MLYQLAPYQKNLDANVLKTHKLHDEDLYTKKKIALLVELGELANELRFFKYWSKDQTPRTALECPACNGKGTYLSRPKIQIECPVCWGSGKNESRNPALEEYIDCIHLILSLIIDHPSYNEDFLKDLKPLHYNNLEDHFSKLYAEISNNLYSNIEFVTRLVLGIGELLGFSDDEIVEMYHVKNEVNLLRQKEGY